MTLEEYLLSLVEGAALSVKQDALSPDERAVAFEAWSANHRPTPDLSDYAVSRESIYEGDDHCVCLLTRTFSCASKPSTLRRCRHLDAMAKHPWFSH